MNFGQWSSPTTQTPERFSLIDLSRILLLATLLSVCCASWWFDPLAPVNTGPAGYLGIPLEFSFNIREVCKMHEVKLASCKRSSPTIKPNEIDAPKGWVDSLVEKAEQQRGASESQSGSFGSLLRRAGGMDADQPSSPRRDGEAECSEFKFIVDSCRAAARDAKEKAQLRCTSEVAAHWTCLQAESNGEQVRQ